MAHNDQNDEYKFDEYDSYEGESMDHNEFGSSDSPSGEQPPKPPRKDVRRNALIAVGAIAFLMIMYKLLGGLFSGKSNNVRKNNIPTAPVTQIAPTPVSQQPPQVITPQPVQPVQDTALKQQVESIGASQQNLQSQVSSLSEQLNSVNNNVNNLAAQVNQLNQTVTNLTNQLSRQSEVINMLIERTKPKPVKHVRRPRYLNNSQPNIYYINAVIPGRAWLIGTNGSTLTVREGTKISGYGVVRLIDSMQGRVLTSSGRVIRFSQDDS